MGLSNLTAAVENGDLNNMKWLQANNCPWDSDTFKEAAYQGHFEVLVWLLHNYCPWDENTFRRLYFKKAVKNGF